MNFLAHFYLSGSETELLVGNFLADFIRGNNYRHLPDSVQKGITLHRLIDSFTDSHESTKQVNALLRPHFGKYAPVVSDIFYDYCLANTWKIYSTISLQEFAQSVYDTLALKESLFEPKVARVVCRMSKENWLIHYASEYGIRQSLLGIERRTDGRAKVAGGEKILTLYSEEITKSFSLLFPDMIEKVTLWREQSL